MKRIFGKLKKTWRLEKMFLSVGGLGYLPHAPGTYGSLAPLPLLYFFQHINFPILFLLPIFVLLVVGSSMTIHHFQEHHKTFDPSWIVIDEVIGMILTWSFYPFVGIIGLTAQFILFRLFDIWKPWPVFYFDQQKSHGAYVVLDDLAAGVLAGLCFLLGKFFFSFFSFNF